jgi:hypothetical protein
MAALPIQLSLDDMKTIAEMVADLVGRPKNQSKSTHGITPAAIPACDVARYLGMSRARFYEVLLVDQELADAAIKVGSKRLWQIVFLDSWLAKQQGKKIEPRPNVAAK